MNKRKRIELFYYFVIGVLEATNVPSKFKFETIVEEVNAIKEMEEED